MTTETQIILNRYDWPLSAAAIDRSRLSFLLRKLPTVAIAHRVGISKAAIYAFLKYEGAKFRTHNLRTILEVLNEPIYTFFGLLAENDVFFIDVIDKVPGVVPIMRQHHRAYSARSYWRQSPNPLGPHRNALKSIRLQNIFERFVLPEFFDDLILAFDEIFKEQS